ncbi:Chromate resistance protein ChrB [Sinomonas sp. G460-2]|uniref:Chromate resistance protein ChrB n=1 Tax=Sinomonas sp. G460-2 TaxID=3393464 RepID=UPI0039F0444D
MNRIPIGPDDWVLLNYRMPRVPSSPRVAVWRRLQSLGAAQLSDGLVGLPADARTKEHLEWIAAEVIANGGTATVWVAKPTSPTKEREIVASMQHERREEYIALIRDAADAENLTEPSRTRAAKRLQGFLRKIARRDYFPPAERDAARAMVKALLKPAQGTPAEHPLGPATPVREEASQ